MIITKNINKKNKLKEEEEDMEEKVLIIERIDRRKMVNKIKAISTVQKGLLFTLLPILFWVVFASWLPIFPETGNESLKLASNFAT